MDIKTELIKLMDEFQENAVYFLFGFLLSLVLSLFIDALWILALGFLFIAIREIISRHRNLKNT